MAKRKKTPTIRKFWEKTRRTLLQNCRCGSRERGGAQEKFQIKLREPNLRWQKEENMLEYQEISDFFSDMQLDAEQFEKILDFLEAKQHRRASYYG